MATKPAQEPSRNRLAALRRSPAPLSNLKAYAYARLKEDIVLGRHAFGAVLSPRRLGEEMGMSFLPVADALRMLEAEGLVETRDRVGTRVRVPTAEDIKGVYTLREAFESQAARLCSQKMTPAVAKRLMSMAREVDRMYGQCTRQSGASDLWAETTVFHANFHRFIAECAQCPMLTQAIENSQVFTFKLLFDSALRRKKRPRDWHQSFVAAILSGDARKADEAARRHVSYGVTDVLQRLDELQPENRWRRLAAAKD